MNPFETLGIAPSFSLSLEDLAARQRELSKQLHPDRYVGRPAGERRAALGKAIEVNEAARVLKNPLTRAEALLAHLGLQIPEGAEPKASQELLMQTMERREALRDSGKRGEKEAILRLVAEVKAEEKQLVAALESAFSAAESERALRDSPLSLAIHEKLANLRYLRRFLDEADAHLDELF